MPLDLETTAQGLGNLLASGRLRVPQHQRPFAWTEDEVSRLWLDIRRAQREEPDGYFIGPLVLSSQSPSGRHHFVIDGQQRLACAALLISAMAAHLSRHCDQDRARLLAGEYLVTRDIDTLESDPKLVLGEYDDNYFRTIVNTAISGSPIPEPNPRVGSQVRLHKAYTYFESQIAMQFPITFDNWKAGLLELKNYLHDSVEAICVNIGADQNAYLIFETLNDRGLRLTTSDLLKNYLFSQAGDKLEHVRSDWSHITTSLDDVSPDDSMPLFLRHHWISTQGFIRQKDLYRTISNRIQSSTGSADFTAELVSSADLYADLTNPSHPRWNPYGTSVRNHLSELQIFRVVTPMPLLLSGLAVLNEKRFCQIVAAVKRWSIRLAISGRLGSGGVEEAYGEASRRIRSGEITSIGKLTSFMRRVLPDDENFRAAFATSGARNNRQARYLLASLEQQARMELSKSTDLVPSLDESVVNIQHILPRNPASAEWSHVSADDRQIFTNRLGNIALFSVEDNRRVGAGSFDDGRVFYESSGLVLTREIADVPQWDRLAIVTRQNRLADLAVRTWPL